MASHYESRRTGKSDTRVSDRGAAHCEPTVAHHDVATTQWLFIARDANHELGRSRLHQPGRLTAARLDLHCGALILGSVAHSVLMATDDES
jgi:hypothetical protein